MKDNRKLAEKIVDELLTCYGSYGKPIKGHRLAIKKERTGFSESDLGGRCRESAIRDVLDILDKEVGK